MWSHPADWRDNDPNGGFSDPADPPRGSGNDLWEYIGNMFDLLPYSVSGWRTLLPGADRVIRADDCAFIGSCMQIAPTCWPDQCNRLDRNEQEEHMEAPTLTDGEIELAETGAIAQFERESGLILTSAERL